MGYDARSGRLSTRTYPIGSQRLNPYSYLNNSPFGGTDPTGFDEADNKDQSQSQGVAYDDGAGLVAAEIGDTAASGSTIQANRAAGEAFEQQYMATLKETNTDVVQQVTVKTASGIRTRIDLMSRDVNGRIVCTECKASSTAPLTRNQAAAFPDIQRSGATVVGKGKPPFSGGTQIPPTTVQIVRP